MDKAAHRAAVTRQLGQPSVFKVKTVVRDQSEAVPRDLSMIIVV
jgi:hypothetical protein